MKVIIVGGGIAGLSAGIYARQSGFDTTIFEMHSIPGGNSTSWRRKGCLFEGGMHWLVGSSEKAPGHKIWKEIGALQDNNPVYNRDPFLTYIDGGETICLYRNADRLKKHLLEISPEDEKAINTLIKDIKAFGKMSMPVTDIKGVKLKYKSTPPVSMLFAMLGALARMGKLSKITVAQYANRFEHKGIRAMLRSVVGRSEYCASSIAFTLGGFSVGDAGYPQGGSLRMAQNMADTFTSLGGKIEYNKRVEKVLVENGKAAGVLVDGKAYNSDAVIVTVDALAAIDKLFDAPLHEPWMEELRREITPINCTFVSLGVAADLSHMPENMLFPLKNPFEYGSQRVDTIGFNNYASYKDYSPKGCTAMTCALIEDNYDQWQQAARDGTYEQKKQELAGLIIDRLGELVPETLGKVEVWDVATPLTYERYCGTYRGSWMSVMKTGQHRQQYPCKSEQINRLCFAGQRLMIPGGLPVASSTGRMAVQHLCKDAGEVFQAEY